MADVGLEQAKELREGLTKAARTLRLLGFTHSEALESEVAFRYNLAVNFLTLLHADTCRMIQKWQGEVS